jgi:membrane protease YdiL (CAAX protease family)
MTLTRRLVLFFSIAYAYSWAVEAWMILAHARIEFSILATAGPLIAAVVTNRLDRGGYRAFRFNLEWRRTLLAAAAGVLLVVVSFVILPALAIADAGKLNWSVLASVGVYNYSTLLGGPLFEEPGWRGYALPMLETRFNPFLASLILGVIWSAWHLPFFLYPGWSSCPVWVYFVIVTGLSVMMTFGANVARFGVIAPILMHAIFNTQGKFLDGIFATANPGSGGFLVPLANRLAQVAGMSASISFPLVVGLCGWTGALFVLALTLGRLGYPAKANGR